MVLNALIDADIIINHHSLYLKEHAPTIHQEYVSHENAYAQSSISPEITLLMSNPTFTHAVEDKIGFFSTAEFQVDPNKDVFVRFPGTENYEKIALPQDQSIDAELTKIIRKTQNTYRRFQESQPRTPECATPSSPLSPFRFSPNPGELSPRCEEDLRSQLSDLQHELNILKLQRELDQKNHQVQELLRQVRELQQSHHVDADTLQEDTRPLFDGDKDPSLSQTIQGLQNQPKMQSLNNEELLARLEALAIQKQEEVKALQDQLDDVHALFDFDARPLPTTIRNLMQKAASLDLLQEEVARLQRIIQENQHTIPKEDSQLQAIAQLKKQLDSLKETLLQKDAQITSLLEDAHKLQEQHRNDNHHAKEVCAFASDCQKRSTEVERQLATSATELRSLQEEIDSLRHANTELRKEHDAIAWNFPQDGRSLHTQISDLLCDLELKKDEITNLQRKLSATSKAQDRVEEAHSNPQEELHHPCSHSEEIAAPISKSACSALDVDLSANLPAQAKSLKKQNDRLSSTNSILLKVIINLQSKFEALTLTKKAFEAAFSTLQAQLSRAEEELSRLRPLSEEVSALKSNIQGACSALGASSSADLPAQVTSLKGKFDGLSSTNPILLKVITNLQSKFETLTLTKKAFEAAFSTLQAQLSRAEEELRQLRSHSKEAAALTSTLQGVRSALGASSGADLQIQATALKEQCDRLSNTNPILLKVIANLQREFEALFQSQQTSESARSDLQVQLTRAEEELGQLRPLSKEVAALQSTLQGVCSALDAGSDADLQVQATALKKQCDRLRKGNSTLHATIAFLQSKFETLILTKKAFESAFSTLQEKLTRAEEELHQLRSHSDEAVALQSTLQGVRSVLGASSGADLPVQVTSLKEQLDRLNKEQPALQQENTRLQRELEAFAQSQQTSESALSALQAQLARAEEELRQLRSHSEKAAALTSTLQGAYSALGIDSSADLPAQVTSLKEQLDRLNKEQPALQQENTRLQRELEALTQTQQTSESAHSDLQEKLTRAEEELRQLRPLSEEVAALTSTLQGACSASGASSSADLPVQVTSLKEQCDRLSKEDPALREANASLQRELEALTQTQQTSEAARSDLQAQLARAKEELDQLRSHSDEAAALQSTLQEACSALGASSSADLPAQVTSLKGQLDSLSKEDPALREANASLQRELEALTQTQQTSEAARSDLQAQLARAKEELDQLRSHSDEAAALQSTLQEACSALGASSSADLPIQVTSLKRQLDSLSEQTPALQQENASLQERLSQMQADMQKIEAENRMLRGLIAKIMGLSVDSQAQDLDRAAEDFAQHYGSTTQVIQERDLARKQLEQITQELRKVQAALEEFQRKEQQAALDEERRQQQLREEQQRRAQEEILAAQLTQLAAAAVAGAAVAGAAVAGAAEVEEEPPPQVEDDNQAQVLHAEQGLQAIVHAMEHGAVVHLPQITAKQREVLSANIGALKGTDKVNIDTLSRKLLGKYNVTTKAPVALLAMFSNEAKKIREFCDGIREILSRKVRAEETELNLANQTHFEALQTLQTMLRDSTSRTSNLQRRRSEGLPLSHADLQESERLSTLIPRINQEISQIAERFIPALLNKFVDKNKRCFPYIIRELEGWIHFFNGLDKKHFKDAQGKIRIQLKEGPDYQVERFRQAITRLHKTLKPFFEMIEAHEGP